MGIDLGAAGVSLDVRLSDESAIRQEQLALIREIRRLQESSRIPWTNDAELLQQINVKSERLQEISAPPASEGEETVEST